MTDEKTPPPSTHVMPIASWREQAAFEEWAKESRYEMHQHPLHYLFVDKQTNAARQGWKAALQFICKIQQPSPEPNVDVDTEVAIALGAAVLTRIEDPALREAAIRNALTMASQNPSPETKMTAEEAWSLFDSRRFLHGHRETMRDSFIIAFKALSCTSSPETRALGASQDDVAP